MYVIKGINSQMLFKVILLMYKHEVCSTFCRSGPRVCAVRDSGTREK